MAPGDALRTGTEVPASAEKPLRGSERANPRDRSKEIRAPGGGFHFEPPVSNRGWMRAARQVG